MTRRLMISSAKGAVALALLLAFLNAVWNVGGVVQ